MDRFGITDPGSIIFIDDEKENIRGAEYVGWHGIHFTNARKLNIKLSNLLQ